MEEEGSRSLTKARDRGGRYQQRTAKVEKDAASVTSMSITSVTPSMANKRRVLQRKEDEIEQKTKALEEAERLALEKEEQIKARLAALDAAEVSFLESVNIDRIVQDRIKNKIKDEKEVKSASRHAENGDEKEKDGSHVAPSKPESGKQEVPSKPSRAKSDNVNITIEMPTVSAEVNNKKKQKEKTEKKSFFKKPSFLAKKKNMQREV